MLPDLLDGQAIGIRQSNALVTAQYKMSLMEMRVFLLWLAQIKPDDTDFKLYNIRTKHLKDLAGGKSEGIYSKMDQLTEQLMNRRLRIYHEGNNGFIKIALVSYAEYNGKKGLLQIRPDPALKPHLLELKGNFTMIDLYVLLSLRGTHAIRIYKLLKSQQWRTKTVTVEVDELKAMLGVTDAYSRYNDFERYVIKHAIEEINEKTDITTSTTRIKQGRRIHALRFTIEKKKSVDLPFPDETLKALQAGEGNDGLKQQMLEIGLSQQQVNQYTSSHDSDYLTKLLISTQKRFTAGKIKNPAAYLVKLIQTKANVDTPVRKAPKPKKKVVKADHSQTLIAELRQQFNEYVRDQQDTLLEEATETDWQNFAKAYRQLGGPVVTKLFKSGELNQDDPETISWFRYYLLPNTDDQFVAWAKNEGHALAKAVQAETGFVLQTTS